MIESWTRTSLGELCDSAGGELQTGPFGSQLHQSDYVEGAGVPVIPTSAIGRRRIASEEIPRVEISKAEELARHRVIPGDILFARRGVQATGLSALVEQKHEGWLAGTGVIRLRLNGSVIDAKYLSFVLAEQSSYEWLRRHAVGSTMPNLNEGVIRGLPVVLPPIVEQHTIASILGALDDKIELNREMNRTLEATAQAIFRSWFVDFDPVVAKADGRKPFGMTDDLAALFPDRFVESELGPMPEGWSWKPVSKALRVNPKRNLDKGQVASYLAMADAPTASAIPCKWEDREYGSGVKFSQGDTLLAKITPCLENGKTAYVGFLERGEVGWGSTEFIVLAARGAIPPEFPYFLARHDEFRAHAIANMTGSSGRQRVPISALAHFEIAIPPDSLLVEFGNVSGPIMTKLVQGVRESKTLAALRDLLLPKLLSGEIRVAEAAERLEAAGA